MTARRSLLPLNLRQELGSDSRRTPSRSPVAMGEQANRQFESVSGLPVRWACRFAFLFASAYDSCIGVSDGIVVLRRWVRFGLEGVVEQPGEHSPVTLGGGARGPATRVVPTRCSRSTQVRGRASASFAAARIAPSVWGLLSTRVSPTFSAASFSRSSA